MHLPRNLAAYSAIAQVNIQLLEELVKITVASLRLITQKLSVQIVFSHVILIVLPWGFSCYYFCFLHDMVPK